MKELYHAYSWGLAALLALAACNDEKPPSGPRLCTNDRQCELTEVCAQGVCMPETGRMKIDAGQDKDAGLKPYDAGPPDLGFKDAEPLPDLGPPDLGTPDLGPPDNGVHPQPDLGVVDMGTSPPDLGPPDLGTPDLGLPDLGTPDLGFPDSGTPDAGAGPLLPGVYSYARVQIPGVPSSQYFASVAISPDGRTMLIGGYTNTYWMMNLPAQTSSISVRLPRGAGNQYINDIAYSRDGSYALMTVNEIASSGRNGKVYKVGPRGQSPVQIGSNLSNIEPMSIVVDPTDGRTFIIANRRVGGGYNMLIYEYIDSSATIPIYAAKATSAGCIGGARVQDGIGGIGLAYTCGVNGAEVGIHDSTGTFVRGPNTGNTSWMVGRPQQDYALAVAWSSGRLSKFEQGQWSVGFNTPSVTHRAYNLAMSDDGNRTLVTGTYSGGTGVLMEYRHGHYSGPEITDVSISGFDASPWLARNGVVLADAAWRPGGDCGYVVGGCGSTQCQRGYLIRFQVINGRSCPP